MFTFFFSSSLVVIWVVFVRRPDLRKAQWSNPKQIRHTVPVSVNRCTKASSFWLVNVTTMMRWELKAILVYFYLILTDFIIIYFKMWSSDKWRLALWFIYLSDAQRKHWGSLILLGFWSNKHKPFFTVTWYFINLIFFFSPHFNPSDLHLISVVFLRAPLRCFGAQSAWLAGRVLLSPQSPRLSQQLLQTDWRTCGQTWPQSLLSSHGSESWPLKKKKKHPWKSFFSFKWRCSGFNF